jgi:PKD repeat protein
MLTASARADTYHATATPGGVQVSPVIDGTPVIVGSNATVNYHGLQAPYVIQVSSNNVDWKNVGMTSLKHPNFSGSGLATNVPSGAGFFRLMMLGSTNWVGKWNTGVLTTNSVFAGAGKCVGCHGSKVAEWSGTKHAVALDAVQSASGVFLSGANSSCLPCHTVGSGQPGGFVSRDATPHLSDVGCESCHGSANAHINISGRQYHPVVSTAPALCGGCHTGAKQPTYDEYVTTKHAEVNDDIKYGFSSGVYFADTLATSTNTLYGYYVTTNANGTLKTNATTGIIHSLHVPGSDYDPGQDRQVGCGICHSAEARMAMLRDYDARLAGYTNALVLPAAEDAAEWSAACVTCHDPHSDANPAQLRNPTRSTNYYTMPTTADKRTGSKLSDVYYMSAAFANMYNPNIQICGQCHNSRGARWDGRSYGFITNGATITFGVQTNVSFSRPPHHSPQYNLLIGIVQDDYLNKTTNMSSPHAGLSSTSGNTNQCIACHVPNYAVSSTTNVTGHTFELNVKGCALAGCHTSYSEDGLHAKIEERQHNASNSIARIVSLLNQWAISNGTNTFGAANANKYKQNGWEFTTIGALATITNAGPSAADQVKLPDAIKQARFNLYMVLHDGSMGVHNVTYSDYLIRAAETNVTSLFPSANFRATSTAGFAPFSATFTNLGTGVTNYSWSFGDGVGTSTSANPSYTYANPGIYTVTFTANGSETMTRTNYIQAVIKPVVSFNANLTTVAIGTPVTFTNTSTSISDAGLWRWQFNLTNNSTRLDGGFTPTATYTYTNVGTFSVTLRASTPAGNVTTTNTAYITVTP